MPVHARPSIIISTCFLALTTVSSPVAAQDLAALRKEIAAVGGRVIVGIKPAGAPRGMARPGVRTLSKVQVLGIAQRLSGFGLRVTRDFGLITAVAAVATDAAVEQLVKDPNVEYVVPDRIHTLQDERGPRRATPRPMVETTPYGIAKIRAPEAWAATSPANYGAGVKVGILDTGGDFDHEDLAYAGGFDAVIGSTAPADWDDNLPACQGHGTHVAGTVGAVRGNALGVVGVAPSASVYAIQIFSEFPGPFGPQCGAFTSDIVNGVDWAVTNGMQILNMSYGGVGFDPAEHAAYQAAVAAGVHLIAAAGNEALQVSQVTPASYPEVIAVSATDVNDAWADFSNFGPEVLISAPGVAVQSTLPGDNYLAYSGTSMASPHTTGLAALLLALDPSLSNASLRGLLGAGAIDLGAPGHDDLFGEGRIDALNSVNLVPQQQTSATQLALVQQPGGGTSGQPLVPAPVVELRDAQNQAVLQAGVVVTATVTSGPGRATVLGSTFKQRTGAPRDTKRPPLETATTAVVTNATGQAVFSSLAISTVVTAPHELTFSAGGLTPVVSAPFTVTGSVTTLTNGVPLPGQAGGAGAFTYYVINIPAGFGVLTVTTSGGTGDVDFAVRQGEVPTLQFFDCASAQFGNEDVCQIANPAAGVWYIGLLGFLDYADVTVTATASGSGATQLAILQQPQAVTSGQPLVPGPMVELRDAQNQPVALAGVLVAAAISSGPGQVSALPAGAAGTSDRAEQGKRRPVQPATTAVLTNASGQAAFSNLVVTSLTTADHELVLSGYNVTSIVSDPFSVTGTTPTPLTNGVPVPGLGGAAGSTAFFVLTVPAGQGSLSVTTTGGTGDADLYVKFGSLPTTASFTCRSFTFTNDETCTILAPDAGEWYVMVLGFDPYAGLTLTAGYASVATQLSLLQQPQDGASGAPLSPAPVVQLLDALNQPVAQAGVIITAAISSGPGQVYGQAQDAGTTAAGKRPPVQVATTSAVTNASGQATFFNLTISTIATADHQLVFTSPNLTAVTSNPFNVTGTPVTALTNGVPVTGLSGGVGSTLYYVLTVPAGQDTLTVVTAGPIGDPDLYVRRGALPTPLVNDCGSFTFTPDEFCGLAAPAAGDWYILVHGYASYSGLTLTATYAAQASLIVTLSGTGGGAITGPNGLNCTLSAGQTSGTCSVPVTNPSSPLLHAQQVAGSSFGGWGGAASSCALLPDCTVQVSGATSVSAVFNSLPDYTVTVAGAGTGSGAVTGGGINCNLNAGAATGTCSTSLDSGTAITLTAAPGATQTFNGWTGACTGAGTCQLTMTTARSVTADFSDPPADVTNMVAELTGTPTLTPAEIQRWDCNSSTDFDVGDLLCYLDNHPGLALSPQVVTAILRRSGAETATRPAATGEVVRTKREN